MAIFEKMILEEELSISNDVKELTDILSSEIIRNINNSKYNQMTMFDYINIKPIQILYKHTIIKDYNCFDKNINVSVICYQFNNKEEYIKYHPFIDTIGGTYNRALNNIELGIVSINDKINVSMLKNFLSHELEHIYQYSLIETKELSSIYKKLINIINNPHNINDVLYGICYCLYFLDKDEINANLHGLYFELKERNVQDLNGLNQTNLLLTYNNVIKLYKEFITLGDDDIKLIESLNYLKLTKNQIIKLIDIGLKYFKNKLGKVWQRYINELTITECKLKKVNKSIYTYNLF